MATLQASDIQGFTITNTIVEGYIDDAIDYINSETYGSISNLSGTAGSKTVTLTNQQRIAVKTLTQLLCRGHTDKGSTTVGMISSSGMMTDPHYATYAKMVDKCISRLIGRDFERT